MCYDDNIIVGIFDSQDAMKKVIKKSGFKKTNGKDFDILECTLNEPDKEALADIKEWATYEQST